MPEPVLDPPWIVAIDGPAAAGKSTVGALVARRLGLPFVDSGLIYRALTCLAQRRSVDPRDTAALVDLCKNMRIEYEGNRIVVDGEDLSAQLHQPGIAPDLALVAQNSAVRSQLLEVQRQLGSKGVVMAGRDIGTVVFPGARWKIYLVARPKVRLERRRRQLSQRGLEVGPKILRQEVAERDRADMERQAAPLRPADDALIVATDEMTAEQVAQHVLALITSG